ncbi:MAG: hypothetical protein KA178_03720 [Alphaproteobacteria bacterium]|nr:hypothetical protein [Alphaproteobacteria bacterium]MBP7758341.1 hypothetical protein [Alphaproteobacteria bacterium]MBP7762336.1 hypothetical protein [Alphaproteobacteria bacterium]
MLASINTVQIIYRRFTLQPDSFIGGGSGHGDRHKGAGLGLAICKAIVMAHEGRIWVEKKMSGDNAKGATFYIFIPASRLVVPDLSKEPM